ncbi:MAG: carboxylate-amine ligase [Wenzhouxiangella sp.]
MPTIDPVTPVLKLHAFEGFGIELEYMIVDRDSMNVRPLADRLLTGADGEVVNEVDHGELAWSNELVQHVLELKTNGPSPSLAGLGERFHCDVVAINQQLSELNACLMPTAMHPLFDPARETRLWPFGQNEIYAAYDRIFGCRGHGWSNLQSMHINLPFFDAEEFRRLHAAIRVVLPLLPALAASSPIEQGQRAAWLDNRLRYYRDNQAAVPSIAGQVVPEAVADLAAYHREILAPMYAAIHQHEPSDLLKDDWLNSRGAIARFERQTIEIRVIDLQECPAADLAIAEAVVALVQAFHEERWAGFAKQQAADTGALARLMWQGAEQGLRVRLDDSSLAALFGVPLGFRLDQLWQHLLERSSPVSAPSAFLLEQMLKRGNLAEAIVRRLDGDLASARIQACYQELGQCLAGNRLFQA